MTMPVVLYSATGCPLCAKYKTLLSSKGIRFEVYDMPGVTWDGEIASLGSMGRAAWFKDSEGNIMCIDQEGSAG